MNLPVTGEPSTTWVASATPDSGFGLTNLPLGVVRLGDDSPPVGVLRIGDEVLDLSALAASGLVEGDALLAARVAGAESLNAFFALGAGPRRALRAAVQDLLRSGSPDQDATAALLHPVDDVQVCLPARIGDYTDFYVGLHHARNVGSVFRPDNPLLPNYGWVPIGYHGRASSIEVSGATVQRPVGQTKAPDADAPTFGPCQRLDFELELGIWVGPGNRLGAPISLDEAEDHVAGYCLLNDWSARDVQAWEYQPLGPFLAKSFASTVSAWVVTPEALAPFRSPFRSGFADETGFPDPLPYLSSASHDAAAGLEVELEVLLRSPLRREREEEPVLITRSSTAYMFWSVAQMLTHHTSNGCNLRPGDLLGSGTLSGPTPGSEGSLLELTRGGPLVLPGGELRTFLQDGDEVTLRAVARRPGVPAVSFGECRAVIAAASPVG